MRTFDETLSALGPPASIVSMDDWSGRNLIVTRWLSEGARIVRSEADALRVVVNLSCASVLRYSQADLDVSLPRTAGDITVIPAGPASETVVDGVVDVLEVFVDPASLGALGSNRSMAKPSFQFADDDLIASAVGLFLAASGKRDMEPQAAAATLGQVVLQLLASHAASGADRNKGGLVPSTLRRIDEMIDTWLDRPNVPHGSVIDLAGVAHLSPSHFIRAFSKTTGVTPYQYVMARRRRRAMTLLCRPGLSIAEISDRLGFSSPAHFIASFRRRFGGTPGDYRDALLDPALLGRGAPA